MTLATKEWVINLLNKAQKKLYKNDKPKTGVNNVMYMNGKPIMATGDVTVYIDADTGSDTTGNGTQANPYKSYVGLVNNVPRNMNGFVLRVHLSGNFTSRFYFYGYYYYTEVYFDNNPTFVGLEFSEMERVHLFGNCSINFNPGTTKYMGAITLFHSYVFLVNGTITIKGVKSSTYIDRGIYAAHGSTFCVQSWNTGTMVIDTFQVCICCQDCSRVNVYNSNMTYKNYATKHEGNGGGTITTT